MATESISKREIPSSKIPKRARRLAWLGPPSLFKGRMRPPMMSCRPELPAP